MAQSYPEQEPAQSVSDVEELAREHLDFYRGLVLLKVHGVPEADLRRTRVPSGWTPLELVRHLTYVERRWLRWGFAGQSVDDVWGDNDPQTGCWAVPEGMSVAEVLSAFDEQVAASRALLAGRSLSERAQPGDRFDDPDEPPTLGWIVFHLIQEYARHLGHLDIVRELTDGATGESAQEVDAGGPQLETGARSE